MKLFDLLAEAIGDLEPGERRQVEVQLRDLNKIDDRVNDLERHLRSSLELAAAFSQNTELQKSLSELRKRLRLKIDSLMAMKSRPTTAMSNMIKTLELECSDFVPEMQRASRFLYRGVRMDADQFEGRSSDARRPKDSNPKISMMFDDMLSELGFQALRSNSIFTTSNYGQAQGYGWDVYIIFPKNEFDWLVTNERDLILDGWSKMMDAAEVEEFGKRAAEWFRSNMEKLPTYVEYTMVNGDWYYLLQTVEVNFAEGNPWGMPDEFDKQGKDFVSMDAFRDNFRPRNDNLADAIASGHEVLVHGEYWALKYSRWQELLRSHFGIQY